MTELERLRRDYAVLRYALEQIRRKVGSENYSSDEGVDPVDIQDMAADALSITEAPKPPFAADALSITEAPKLPFAADALSITEAPRPPFATGASLRRCAHEKLNSKEKDQQWDSTTTSATRAGTTTRYP